MLGLSPRRYRIFSITLFTALLALSGVSSIGLAGEGTAQSTAPPPRSTNEVDAAFDAAGVVAAHGPSDVKLSSHATLKLPQGYVYIPPKEATRLLQAMGNRVGDGVLGMVFPSSEKQEQWFVVMQFDAAGYIKDDDAKDWKADELLDSLKAGTEEANADRRARGISEMEVIGWVEKPHYEFATHQLVWAMSTRQRGAADSASSRKET